MHKTQGILFVILGTLLAGCAEIPMAPSVDVMPAPGEPFSIFRADDVQCRQFASQQLGISPGQAGQQQVISGAAAGTALGAASGALLGRGRAGAVAAGAGAGLMFGALAGMGSADQTGLTLQQRYNLAYEQCMYAHGEQVPGFAPPNDMFPPPPPPPPPP